MCETKIKKLLALRYVRETSKYIDISGSYGDETLVCDLESEAKVERKNIILINATFYVDCIS
jgi:hypothetical protein